MDFVVSLTAGSFSFGSEGSMSADWVKPTSFDGRFYPDSPRILEKMIVDFEKEIEESPPIFSGRVVGVVSPHAGYVFSGSTAARAYHAAQDPHVETIILIGLCHRVHLKGVSVLEAAACETPLGPIEYDQEFQTLLSDRLPRSSFQKKAHLEEHSIETQLPFIKRYFPAARIVEILTQEDQAPVPQTLGMAVAETAEALQRRILIVASTDLSHYPPRDIAEQIDPESLKWIGSLNPEQAEREIRKIESRGEPGVHCAVCSKAAVLAGMTAAQHLGAVQGIQLGYTNSGHSPYGENDRVVGYGAVAWVKNGN